MLTEQSVHRQTDMANYSELLTRHQDKTKVDGSGFKYLSTQTVIKTVTASEKSPAVSH